jgi:hypothetical protein
MPTTFSEAPGKAFHIPFTKHVPFTASLKIVPVKGKRFETYRDLEKEANSIEDALLAMCGVVTDITKPVAFTPQFGNKTARLTISGHACARNTFPKAPVGERRVINAGEYKIGVGASNNSNRIPDSELDSLVVDLKNTIEASTGYKVIRIEAANHIYGVGGVHFPI